MLQIVAIKMPVMSQLHCIFLFIRSIQKSHNPQPPANFDHPPYSLNQPHTSSFLLLAHLHRPLHNGALGSGARNGVISHDHHGSHGDDGPSLHLPHCPRFPPLRNRRDPVLLQAIQTGETDRLPTIRSSASPNVRHNSFFSGPILTFVLVFRTTYIRLGA